MKKISAVLFALSTLATAASVSAQEESSVNREIELGALVTTGNTDEETLNFAGAIDIDRDQWKYAFTLTGMYASSDNVVKGQRIATMARANYQFTEYSFFQSRASHEDDRFSGFDSQSDITFSYGHELLRNFSNMMLTTNAGIGARYSRLEGDGTTTEPILRLAGEYEWTISDSAMFSQDLSVEAGSDSDIYRSLTAIETNILENLSLRFSLTVKHQTEVPVGKKNTDTQTAVTFVMNF